MRRCKSLARSVVNYILLVVFVAGVACAIDKKPDRASLSYNSSINAASFEQKLYCDNDDECKVVDQDCCGAGSLIATNMTTLGIIKKRIYNDCARKLADDKDLCKDKKPSSAASTTPATCVEAQCTIKSEKSDTETPQVAEDQTACDSDYQCQAFDEDCCDAGTTLTAINVRFSGEKRRKKTKDCQEKLKGDKYLCASMRNLKFRTTATVQCVEKKCVIKN